MDNITVRNQEIFIRQGDVIFKKIDDFDKNNLQLTNDNIVALGEATGHSHTFNGQVLLYKTSELEEPKYVEVKESAVLEHQEHLAIQVPEGKYEVIKEQEFNPFTKAITRTRD